MPRLRLYDVRLSRLPELIGKCQADIPDICNYTNSAQRRLLLCRESGDEGWYGTWAEVAFNLVSRSNPYITCPRSIARIARLDVCKRPVIIQNQWYEYLDFGNGRMPKLFRDNLCNTESFTRNHAITATEQSVFPATIRAYPTDISDVQSGKRVLIQGLDSSNNVVYTQDNLNEVTGEFIALDTPFIDTTFQYNRLTGIQKDVTNGPVQIFQVDPATGAETLLLTMEPSEQVAGYQRYYINNLPVSCCPSTTPGAVPQTLQVTALAKLELVPVVTDTDYLLFQNLEAIIEEAQSVRYSEIDKTEAKQMAQEKHLQAVRLLNGELVHYLGKDRPAVNFAPFGSARLSRQNIGNQL